MNKIGIIGIILLSICLCAQTTIGSTNKPSKPPDPLTTDLYDINIASVNNGGSVEYWPNCGIGDGNKNNIIDEDEDSYIFMNIDPQWSSYVIIDFKGEYNYIGDIQIKFRHQSHPTDPGEIEIYLHVKEGNKEHWKRVIKFDNVANGQRFDFSLRNHNNLDFDFFECEADKIKIETEGGFLREWFAYEVKVINTEITPPILKLDSPNEGFLYVLSIPLISTGRDHALVIGNMPIIVNAYDFESGIKEIKLKTPFGTKNPSVSNGNEHRFNNCIYSGKFTYTITAYDKSDNEASLDLKISCLGGNSPALLMDDIEGPSTGNEGQSLTFEAKALEVEGEDIFYRFDWGDGSIGSWVGPVDTVPLVKTTFSASHRYNDEGNYQITVRVRDQNGNMEDYSLSHSVKIEPDSQNNLEGECIELPISPVTPPDCPTTPPTAPEIPDVPEIPDIPDIPDIPGDIDVATTQTIVTTTGNLLI